MLYKIKLIGYVLH